ncbi:MAG: hypothetical protein SPE21_02460, partial [Candidatus Cryptobacteroides sp.]|nr:hypothetical protein [Candidatus Cryptobacteroides sp.]
TVGTYTGVNGGYRVAVNDLPNPLPSEIVWQLEAQGSTNAYYIKTPGVTPYYIDNPATSSEAVKLVPRKTAYFTFDTASGHLTMLSSKSSNYINIHGGQQDLVIGYNVADGGSQFDFYPVSVSKMKVTTPVTYNKPITLTSIDPITAAVSPVNTINRNDFINIVVTVSFNKDAGDLEFEVSEWKNKSGDIKFN